MRKVLIVSYNYPPLPTIGALRISSFARHLPKFGWQPYVVTIKTGKWTPSEADPPPDESEDLVCRTTNLDISRLIRNTFGKTFRGGGVTRSKAIRTKRESFLKAAVQVYDNFLAFPDSAWPWYYLGRQQALAFAQRLDPDAILSSSVPFTSHMLAAYIEKKLHTPWIADFRDLWSQGVWIDYPPYAQRKREAVELEVLRNAAAIIATTELQAEDLRTLHHKPTYVVSNGFEPEEYVNPELPFDKFTIAYTGSLYPGKRDPQLLFAVIRSLHSEKLISPDRLRIVFCGPDHDVTMQMAHAYGITAYVEDHGQVPRAKSLELQKKAHLLLLLEWPNVKAKGGVPAKLFEYLGACRPILAIGPKEGSIDEILKTSGSGQLASDIVEVRKALLEALEIYRQGASSKVSRNDGFVGQFTREHQTEILAARLSEAISWPVLK